MKSTKPDLVSLEVQFSRNTTSSAKARYKDLKTVNMMQKITKCIAADVPGIL